MRGDNLSVDGSFVEANANKGSRIPREQLAEAAEANQTVRQYLVELEQQNPTEEPLQQQDQVSTTDPDATYATKGGTPARLGYCDNYLVDNRSGGVEKGIGYVIYPRSGNTNPRALDEIVSVSQAYVQRWGGVQRLRGASMSDFGFCNS